MTITHIGLDNGLVTNRRQAIIWTNVHQIHWRIYAALGGNEFVMDIPKVRRQLYIETVPR